MLKKALPLVLACMALVACGSGEDEAKEEKPVDIQLPGLSIEADESGIEIRSTDTAEPEATEPEATEPEAVEPEATPENGAVDESSGGYKIEADENGVIIHSPEGQSYEYPKKSDAEEMIREL